MEKVASKVKKLFDSGQLRQMRGQKGNALLEVMNMEGVIPNKFKRAPDGSLTKKPNIHNIINAKAKRMESGNVPKNINTKKGYEKWSDANNLSQSDVLGFRKRRKEVGESNARVIAEAKRVGMHIDPTERSNDPGVKYRQVVKFPIDKANGDKQKRGIRYTTIHDRINTRAINAANLVADGGDKKRGRIVTMGAKWLYEGQSNPRYLDTEDAYKLFGTVRASPSVRNSNTPSLSSGALSFLKRRYPQAAHIVEKNNRTISSAHEIGRTGELANTIRSYKLNSGRWNGGVYNATYVGTHNHPSVLTGDQETIKYLGDPIVKAYNDAVRKQEPAMLRVKNGENVIYGNMSQKDILDRIARKANKPISDLTYKDADAYMPNIAAANNLVDRNIHTKKPRLSRNLRQLSKIPRQSRFFSMYISINKIVCCCYIGHIRIRILVC